jgi:phenylacetate-CoA ligase
LDNYGFPFIRYKIGDISSLSSRKCPCGRGLKLLENVDGRIWDVIIGINGNRIIGSFWLVKNIDGIEQFQILQEEFGKIIIKLIINKLFTDIEKQKLFNRIYETCGQNMNVDIQFVDKIPLTEYGKRRFIISKISPYINQ